jgi:hypothetical protein
MCPANGHASTDTDLVDGADRTPLVAFKTLFPKLYAPDRPRVTACRGEHIPLFIPDVPPDAGKIDKPSILPGLNIEFFLGPKGNTANVIMPPSVHESGHKYVWESSGEAFQILLQQLYLRFALGSQPGSGPESPKDSCWLSRFKGDLRTLDLVSLCQRVGEGCTTLDSKRISIPCPWADNHTKKADWHPDRSDTVLFQSDGASLPGFKCLHAHCAERSLKDFLFWCEYRRPGVVDSCCERYFCAYNVNGVHGPATSASTGPEEKYNREP